MTPSSRRRRWCVVSGGYAASDSAPPANTIVNRPDKIIVGAQAAHEAWRYGLTVKDEHQQQLEKFLSDVIDYIEGDI